MNKDLWKSITFINQAAQSKQSTLNTKFKEFKVSVDKSLQEENLMKEYNLIV